VGVNLVPSSKRRVSEELARAIALAVGARVEVVAVIADYDPPALPSLRQRLGVSSLQLHGSESPELLATLLPAAYRAVRIGSAADVARARAYGGTRLLADAKVEGSLGGTGHAFDWSLVSELARERPLIVAGGLTEDNVGAAVMRLSPFGVDTASGVENGDPRRKDPGKMARFVAAARRAFAELGLDSSGVVDYRGGRNP
jgi:phosphoribosylanthranilate isomerase